MPEYIVRETGYPGQIKQEVVGELVRCEECMWQRKQLLPSGHYWYQCIYGNEGLGFDGDFCSYGERREDV